MSDLAAWPALVLAAGLATRLRPLSDVRAKGAMPVAGEPLIGRILRWLAAAGVRHVVLNLHHRPETITRMVGDGSEWNLRVRYSWESRILGSAGGPRRALPLLEADRFLIINGDTITDCDLHALTRQHVQTGAMVTMALVEGDVNRYGGVLVHSGGIVHGFSRRPAPSVRSDRPDLSVLHFIGVQAVNAETFRDVPDDEPTETVRTLYPALIAAGAGSVRAYCSSAEFLDVGTPADYLHTIDVLASREGRPLDRGVDCRIHARGTVEHCVLWDRVEISAGARLRDCVIADDVVIPEGAGYERCAIARTPVGLTVQPF